MFVKPVRTNVESLNEVRQAPRGFDSRPKGHAATRSPLPTDDASTGHQPSDTWTNTDANTAFICVDATKDAAGWLEITTALLVSGKTALTADWDAGS